MAVTGTIIGQVNNFVQSLSTPASTASVSFTPSVKMITNTLTEEITILQTVWADVQDNGDFTATLVATNSPNTNPVNWTYQVRFHTPGQKIQPFSIQVQGNTTTDLSVLVPVEASSGVLVIQGSPGAQGPKGDPGVSGDHSQLSNLGADDHTQYHNNTRGDVRYYTKAQVDSAVSGKSSTTHTHDASAIVSGVISVARLGTGTANASTYLRGDNTWGIIPTGNTEGSGSTGGGGTTPGVSDHGDLTGLADDDHPQYHNDSRGDTRYYPRAEADTLLAAKSSTGHTHVVNDISNATTLGKDLILSATQAAAKTVLGLPSAYFDGNYNSLTNKPTLGDAAAKNTGTTTGTVSAGDDARFQVGLVRRIIRWNKTTQTWGTVPALPSWAYANWWQSTNDPAATTPPSASVLEDDWWDRADGAVWPLP